MIFNFLSPPNVGGDYRGGFLALTPTRAAITPTKAALFFKHWEYVGECGIEVYYNSDGGKMIITIPGKGTALPE